MKRDVEKNNILEITTVVGCKVSCSYCPQIKFLQKYTKLSDVNILTLQNFKTLLKTVPADVDISFCGMSEPFLNQECPEMILFAHQKGHRVSVDTTLVGTNLSELKKLEKVPLSFLAIHLPSNRDEEKMGHSHLS